MGHKPPQLQQLLGSNIITTSLVEIAYVPETS
jgi:hypothetical protein